jgi:chain length determinant protein (polysaccharide antigen chain regulator)
VSQEVPYDDEIDLFELFETLWDHKFLIAGISFFCGLIGTAWAFLSTPTYEVEVRLLPAEATDLAQYNPVEYASLSGLGIGSLSPDAALTQTLNTMRSVAKMTDFVRQRENETFRDQNTLTDDELFESVASLVSDRLEISKVDDAPQTRVAYQSSSALGSYAFLDALLDWSQAEVLAQRAIEIDNRIARKLEANLLQIKRLTQTYERRIAENVAVLEEAYAIAENLGIVDNQAGVFVAEGEGRLKESNTLYLKGTRLLRAEIDAYEERLSDARFLRKVRLLEEENQTLRDLSAITVDRGSIVAVDKPVSVPEAPVKPNKQLIIALAVVLGGMMAVLFVLIRQAVRNRVPKLAS